MELSLLEALSYFFSMVDFSLLYSFKSFSRFSFCHLIALAAVEHRSVAHIIFPLFPKYIYEGFTLVEARFTVEDLIILVG